MRIKALLVTLAFLLPIAAISGEPTVRLPVNAIDLDVQFDTSAHTVTGVAKLHLPDFGDSKYVGFLLNKDFTVKSVTVAGEQLTMTRSLDFDSSAVTTTYGLHGRWDTKKVAFYRGKLGRAGLTAKYDVVVEVAFTGKLYAAPDNRQFSREKIAFEVDGTIGKEGIYLAPDAMWHPFIPDNLCPYTITARLPKGWNFVTDGVPTEPKAVGSFTEVTYSAEFPVTGLALSAGPFVVHKDKFEDIDVSTYFLPADDSLSASYLEATKRYLALYTKLIGPYPFPKFAVVDNFLPSGYGMAGWTLLGSDVIRLPFIKETSLGHEVLHAWFGNGIMVDYRQGNWCEGLTTYMADYLYKKMSDSASAADYRRNVLSEYVQYVHKDNDYPLSKFTGRSDMRDRSIGYGKCAMVFHMMREMLDQNDTTFFTTMLQEAARNYMGKTMSWENWRQIFESLGGSGGDFFDQWVNRPGIPAISLTDGQTNFSGGYWDAMFTVKTTYDTTQAPYNYFLKLRCISDEGIIDYSVYINMPEQVVQLQGPGKLQAIKADPGYDLFRVTYPSESPLTMGAFSGDKDGVFVVPSKGTHIDQYKAVANGLKSETQKVVVDTSVTADQKKGSFWILGGPEENALWKAYPPGDANITWIPGKAAKYKEDKPVPPAFSFRGQEYRGGAFTGTMITLNPKADGKCIVYTICSQDADPVAGTRKLPHYGKYSYLLFDGDTNKVKGAWAASGSSPMVWIPPAH